MPGKRHNYKTYKNRFKRVVKNKIPVRGIKYDTYVEEVIEDVTEFRQCYSLDSKVRQQLPKHWFISKEGFIISVLGEQPKWIQPILEAKRAEFKISKYGKSVTTYTLVAIVWDSDITYGAKKILDERGIRAFGRLKKVRGQHVARVQAHHVETYRKERTLENYIANNDPSNMQLVTAKEHDVLNKIQERKINPWILYQSRFQNMPSSSVQMYDLENAKMLDFNKMIIKEVQKVYFIPRVEDSIMINDYIIVLENGREFLEEKQELLKDIFKNKQMDPKKNNYSYEIYNGEKYVIMEFLGKILRYKKIKE